MPDEVKETAKTRFRKILFSVFFAWIFLIVVLLTLPKNIMLFCDSGYDFMQELFCNPGERIRWFALNMFFSIPFSVPLISGYFFVLSAFLPDDTDSSDLKRKKQYVLIFLTAPIALFILSLFFF